MIPFGSKVKTKAVVSPKYVTSDELGYRDLFSARGKLLEGSEVPPEGVHRRLFRQEAETEAIVVGHTFRVEGQYHKGAGATTSWDGEHDYDPSYLVESRRVKVYQLALNPGGTVISPAVTILALPEDVVPV